MYQHNNLSLDWQPSLKLIENLINSDLQVCCGKYIVKNQLHQEIFKILYYVVKNQLHQEIFKILYLLRLQRGKVVIVKFKERNKYLKIGVISWGDDNKEEFFQFLGNLISLEEYNKKIVVRNNETTCCRWYCRRLQKNCHSNYRCCSNSHFSGSECLVAKNFGLHLESEKCTVSWIFPRCKKHWILRSVRVFLCFIRDRMRHDFLF